MKTLEEQLDSYGSYHQNRRNKLCHLIGIPLVVFSLLLFLSWWIWNIGGVHISFAIIFCVAMSIYYIVLDWRFGALVIAAMLPILLGAHFVATFETHSVQVFWAAFVIGWFFQLLGHYFEGRRPALLDNFGQIFNAPLFIVVEIRDLLARKS